MCEICFDKFDIADQKIANRFNKLINDLIKGNAFLRKRYLFLVLFYSIFYRVKYKCYVINLINNVGLYFSYTNLKNKNRKELFNIYNDFVDLPV